MQTAFRDTLVSAFDSAWAAEIQQPPPLLVPIAKDTNLLEAARALIELALCMTISDVA
jgi:hypothetical protein